MEVSLLGTGGAAGWPQPGCRCASCALARSAGRRREPARILVDGVLLIDSGGPPAPVPGAPPTDHRVERVPGGWAVTGPDHGRLLVAEGPADALPRDIGPRDIGPHDIGPHDQPYDLVLLDLLEDPAQLGALRRAGLVGARTAVAVRHADHRVSSEEELARRCRFWDAIVPHDGDVLTAAASPAPADAATRDAATRDAGAAPSQPRRVLVLGGARSGKSRHAELRLAAEPRVTYLAAGPYPAGARPVADADWAQRVAAHQARRPRWWRTVESTDAAEVLRSESGAILFDGAGTWLAAVMEESGAWAGVADAQDLITAKVEDLVGAWRQTRARVVAVSDEVGASIHSPTSAGRLFRDQLGWLNQRLAAESEEAVLMVAGRALTLPT